MRPTQGVILLRYPGWVTPGQLKVRVNGQEMKYTTSPGEYVAISRQWQAGDKISVTLPMQTTLEALPDGSNHFAILHGPIVLAAKTGTNDLEGLFADDSRMAHVAYGKLTPPEKTPFLVGEKSGVLSKIKKVKGKPLTFMLSDAVYPATFRKLELIPFFRLHDARYTLYWQITDQKGLQKMQQERMAAEKAALELEARTLDWVAPGEQQPEAEHLLKTENSETGIHLNRHWRHASGWFSYRLNNKNQQAATLQVTYFGLDQNRHFDIWLNDHKITDVHLDGSHGAGFFTVDYSVPPALRQNKDQEFLTVKFVAQPGSLAGGVYGVRLMK